VFAPKLRCTYSFKIGEIFHSKTPHNDSHNTHVTHEREREKRERTTINCTTTCVTTLQNNNTMSEEEEQQEQLRRRLENKEMELLEFERMLQTREREFRLQQELIECLETRNRELEEERRGILGSSTTLATLRGNEDKTKATVVEEEEEEENLSSPVYDAVASMFGRFTGLGGTTTTTTDTAGNGVKVYDDEVDDFDDEVRERGEQEGIVNIVVSEDENNKSGGPSSSRVSFVPGLVSVKDKRRLMFAVVDAEIDATQFVGLRRMSKEEKERMTTTTTSGSSNGGKQRNRHLKTLAQYLMHRSASQENLGTTTTTNNGSNSKNNNNANNSNDEGENLSSSSSMEMYEILWKEDGEMKRLAFEANAEGFIHVSKRVQKWSEEAKIAINAMCADTIPSSNDVVVVAASSAVEKEEEGEKQTKRILEPMPKSQVSQQPELVGYAVKNAPIIDQMIQSCLISALPSRFRRSAWTLKYSSKRDGISLHSLYRAVRHSPATVLAVRDTNGYCFGAFSTEVWSTQNANRYFGTGESFVFAIEKDGDDTVTCFSWSGKNDYFQIAKSESLGVGGGSNYALWIDEDFTRGISGSYCETYNSECLASGEDFDVLNVEIYGID